MEHEGKILQSYPGAKTDERKQQRRHFCEWPLVFDEDFVPLVIWTDEKFFVLHQKPY